MTEQLQTPFYDPMLEDALVGAAIVDQDCYNLISGIVTADHFWQPDCRMCWQEMVAIRATGADCHSALVLRNLGLKAPGAARMDEILERAASPFIIETEAATLVRLAAAREMFYRMKESILAAQDADAGEWLAAARLMAEGIESTVGRQLEPSLDVAKRLLAKADDPASVAVKQSGFNPFDVVTGGLPYGVTVIAGRPSMGKSALAHNVMIEVAKQRAGDVLYFSIESDNEETLQRIAAGEAGVEYAFIRYNNMRRAERDAYVGSLEMLAGLPLYMLDIAGLTPSRIRAEATRRQKQGSLALVVVDYVQSVKPDRREKDRRSEVSAVMLSLRDMARDLNVPVIAVAQLNRDSEKIKRRPGLSDLAESGDLEQAAHLVVFPFRPKKFGMAQENGAQYDDHYAELIVAKNRNGSDGKQELRWNGALVRFEP